MRVTEWLLTHIHTHATVPLHLSHILATSKCVCAYVSDDGGGCVTPPHYRLCVRACAL